VQITVAPPGDTDNSADLTLRLEIPAITCTVCCDRPSQWFDAPAATTAMNPDTSPIGAPDICSVCLNAMIGEGLVEITDVAPDSF
jgi:hypothetical protein